MKYLLSSYLLLILSQIVAAQPSFSLLLKNSLASLPNTAWIGLIYYKLW